MTTIDLRLGYRPTCRPYAGYTTRKSDPGHQGQAAEGRNMLNEEHALQPPEG